MDYTVSELAICPQNNHLLENLDLFTNLKILYIDNCSSTLLNVINNNTIEELWFTSCHFSSLNITNCCNLNRIAYTIGTLRSLNITKCDNLIRLFITNNNLFSNIKPNFISLGLDPDFNRLSLNSDLCPKLIALNIRDNKLLWLNLNMYPNIRYLNCAENKLSNLDFEACVHLEHLNCANNQLSNLDLKACVNLEHLNISNNNFKIIPLSNFQLKNLYKIYVSGNEIVYTPIQIRLLKLINADFRHDVIIDNKQNIHDVNISNCILESFNNILCNENYTKCENVINTILEDDILDTNVKNILLEYASDKTVHTMLKVNFEQVLSYIYPLHDKNSLKILENEMLDSECMCFTGRMFRLINSVNGIIPEVKVEISLNQDLNNMAKFISEMDIDNAKEVFLKNVFDKYPDINQEYLQPWLDELSLV